MLKVADTGVGIPSRDLSRIFERFYRVDRARSRQSGGTGLGLSIVRHVVENHRGEISVESELGVGTRFEIRFPSSSAGASTREAKPDTASNMTDRPGPPDSGDGPPRGYPAPVTLLLLIRHGVTDATGTRLVGWTPGCICPCADANKPTPCATALPVSASMRSIRARSSGAGRRRSRSPSSAGLPVRIRKDIGEVAYGTWTQPVAVAAGEDQALAARADGSVPGALPRGRSDERGALARGRRTRSDRAAHPEAAVAAFSHADVIKLAVAEFAGMHLDLFQRIVVDPASVCALEVGDGSRACCGSTTRARSTPSPLDAGAHAEPVSSTSSEPDRRSEGWRRGAPGSCPRRCRPAPPAGPA